MYHHLQLVWLSLMLLLKRAHLLIPFCVTHAQAVHPDAYRLRILNACNTRTMQLRFARYACVFPAAACVVALSVLPLVTECAFLTPTPNTTTTNAHDPTTNTQQQPYYNPTRSTTTGARSPRSTLCPPSTSPPCCPSTSSETREASSHRCVWMVFWLMCGVTSCVLDLSGCSRAVWLQDVFE